MKIQERGTEQMVIVIGATGFIGMYTVDRFLEEGYEVLATGRNAIMKQELEAKGVTCVSLDISKKEDFDKLPTEGVEGVILLAGLASGKCTGGYQCR